MTDMPAEYREAIADWLRANQIDPSTVPLTARITIATRDGGKVIRYETYVRAPAGLFAPTVVREEHEAPLLVHPADVPAR